MNVTSFVQRGLGSMPFGTFRLAAALSAVALLGGTAAQADAHAKAEHERTFPVVANYTEPPPALDGYACHGLSGAPSNVGLSTCRLYVTGDAYFTGDFKGVQHYNLGAWVDDKGRLAYEGTPTFDAVVSGCGRGTFQIEESDGWIDYTTYTPSTGGATGFNRWRVLPETATGELAGRLLGGSGVNNWTSYSLGKFDSGGPSIGSDREGGRGTFTGSVTCRS